MAESLSGIAGEALRATIAGEFSGGRISITIGANYVAVRDIGIDAVSLGTLYAGYQIIARRMDDAVKRALGGERDDQGDPDISPGSLHVQLHCYTKKRFLEVLAEYKSGRMKTRLQEEFFKAGIEVKGLTVGMKDLAEKDKTR